MQNLLRTHTHTRAHVRMCRVYLLNSTNSPLRQKQFVPVTKKLDPMNNCAIKIRNASGNLIQPLFLFLIFWKHVFCGSPRNPKFPFADTDAVWRPVSWKSFHSLHRSATLPSSSSRSVWEHKANLWSTRPLYELLMSNSYQGQETPTLNLTGWTRKHF